MKNIVRRKIITDGVSKLRSIREELNLSPTEMALKLNLDRSTYYKYEAGQRFFSYETMGRLYNDFGISLDWFFFGKKPKYHSEKDKEPQTVEVVKIETKPHPIEEIMPDSRELMDYMVKDPGLRFEVMKNFYAYKKGKEHNPLVETEEPAQ